MEEAETMCTYSLCREFQEWWVQNCSDLLNKSICDIISQNKVEIDVSVGFCAEIVLNTHVRLCRDMHA